MNFEQALRDPAQVFDKPADVCEERSLSEEQKIQILRRWEYDAREIQVAEEENMRGESSPLLDEVLAALKALNAAPDPEHDAPTKQGGD